MSPRAWGAAGVESAARPLPCPGLSLLVCGVGTVPALPPRCPAARPRRGWCGLWPCASGMSDFNYLHSNCFEITVELGCVKFPPEEALYTIWQHNKEPLLNFVEMVSSGRPRSGPAGAWRLEDRVRSPRSPLNLLVQHTV